MVPVKSKSIKQVKHIVEMSTLKVEFLNGEKYNYHPVTQQQYDSFMGADSKGKYLNRHFRGKGKKVFN